MTQTPRLGLEDFRETAGAIEREVGKVIVGHRQLVHELMTALLAGGHVLLEGAPGLGKTLLVRTIAQIVRCSFSRIQFTPDLMPADIVGTVIIVEDEARQRSFRYQPGPIFANLVLADEINRATPKTQSALLEAMQEHAVTVAKETRPLPRPFFVLATQNPIELEGTYPLPEAQLDRFLFKLDVTMPGLEDLVAIADRTTGVETPRLAAVADGATLLAMQQMAREVPIATHVTTYAARLVQATHPDGPGAPAAVRQFVRYGSSPRGLQAVVLAAKIRALLDGRHNASIEDVAAALLPALRHRLILNYEGQAEGITSDAILRQVLETVQARLPARA
jgi:MoxR-like ATPase